MKKKLLLMLLVIFTLSLFAKPAENFYAYYTSYGEGDDITGSYADVVVMLGDNRKVIFSRKTSYLPFLKNGDQKHLFDEIVERSGDGTDLRPDADNKYSYVRIIKNTPNEILVHWRYMPDFANVDFDGVVHEYFYFYPDGEVKRIVKEGTDDLVDFNDPLNKTIQEVQLTKNGLSQVSFKAAQLSKADLPPVDGSPVKNYSAMKPALWLKFDEGLTTRKYQDKDLVKDAILGGLSEVKGNITSFKKGVSGTALAFDGYNSKVVIPQDQRPAMENGFTIDTWIALDAYPFNWAPVVDLVANEQLYFGINDIGQLGFNYHLDGDTLWVISEEEIPLYQWTNIAVKADPNNKNVAIFINGKKVKESRFDFEEIGFPLVDIFLGLNRIPNRTTYHVSRDYPPFVRTPEGNQPMIFGLEALIDEFKIFTSPLSAKEIKKVYQSQKPSNEIVNDADLEKRILPGEVDGNNAEKFGAYYTNLKYHDLWDNLWRTSDFPDVAVRFDQLPTSVVYWRGTNYGPGWVTEENIWMCDQSSEIYNYYGCSEHMADKQNRYSHVRIIENNPARVVVHWRYASNDITYAFQNRKTWSDEYHYIYPDGSAIRMVNYYDEAKPGWQDVQFFSPAGETPEDQINLQALTVANLKGEIEKMDWTNEVPQNSIEDEVISIVNFKSDYKVMVIYPQDQIEGIGAWGEQERLDKNKTHFAGPWNHWPVSQMPNDGRYAPRQDRVTHSALGGGGPRDFALYGFTNKPIEELIPLGRFFNNAPSIQNVEGAMNAEFVQSEKAYHMTAKSSDISFDIDASEESPAVNPAFVVENWNKKKASVYLNGEKVNEGDNLRIGYNYTADGIDLVVWMKIEYEDPVEISFNKNIDSVLQGAETSTKAPPATEVIDELEWPENPPEDWVTYHLAHPGPSHPWKDGIGGGDPNAAFFYNGRYHLHMIYDDANACCYAHVSSKDMVHWEWHPTVLGRESKGHGMYSGTGIFTDDGTPAIIYHGFEFEEDVPSRNWICYALDDNLDSWSESVLVDMKDENGESIERAWDPDLWKNGNAWYTITGGDDPPLNRSSDLKTWEWVGDLFHEDFDAEVLGVSREEDISCPNMLQIGGKSMLLCLSHELGCHYYLGDFVDEQFLPEFHAVMNWDGGPISCFAPESWLAADGRRVMVAWMLGAEPPTGIQTLPRELELPEDGVLRIRPIRELKSLRYDEVSEEDITISKDSVYKFDKASGDALELKVTFEAPLPEEFGINLLGDEDGRDGLTFEFGKSRHTFTIRGNGTIHPDLTLGENEELTLRVFIDKRIVEVFANERQAVVYQHHVLCENPNIGIFANDADVNVNKIMAWKMKSAFK